MAEPMTQVTIRLPTPMTNRLQEAADRQGISLARIIWAKISRALEIEDREAKR